MLLNASKCSQCTKNQCIESQLDDSWRWTDQYSFLHISLTPITLLYGGYGLAQCLHANPACIGCLEWFTNTKSKCGCPIVTAGLCGFVVLLLLLQHWSTQCVCAVLGLYNSSPFKNNKFQAQNQCLNQRPQVSRGICSFGRVQIPIISWSESYLLYEVIYS